MVNCNLKKNRSKAICRKSEAEFSIIIPKRDNSGRKVKHKVLHRYIERVNGIFGGSTAKPITLGCWYDKKRRKIQFEEGFAIMAVRDFDTPYNERISRIKTNKGREDQLRKDHNAVKRIAKTIAKDLGQDSVMVVYDNIVDASFERGKWKKKISDLKVYKKNRLGKTDLFKKYI